MKDDPAEPIWSGPATVCVALWKTADGPALSLERVSALGDEALSGIDDRIDPLWGVNGLQGVLNSLLDGTGMDWKTPIAHLLGTHETLLEGQADYAHVTALRIESPDVVRGVPLIEGLFVEVEPSASETVARLALQKNDDEFDDTYRLQASVFPWSWNPVPLVDEPVESGAKISIREDGRRVFLNMEAMSIYHDYDGIGGRHLVIACIPQVITLARLASACTFVVSMLEAFKPESLITQRELRQLEVARFTVELAQNRHVLWAYSQKFNHTEKFATWTHGGNLAALLSRSLEPRGLALSEQMEMMGATIGRSIEAKVQRTTAALQQDEETRNARRPMRVLFQAVTLGVAAVSLLLGLFMTTAAAPAWGSDGTIGIWPWSFVVVGGTVVVGTILGFVFRRFR